MPPNEISADEVIADLDRRIDLVLPAVQTVIAEQASAAAAYKALATRAAHGEDVPDAEWEAVEQAIDRLSRRHARSLSILEAHGADILALGKLLPLAAAGCAGSA